MVEHLSTLDFLQAFAAVFAIALSFVHVRRANVAIPEKINEVERLSEENRALKSLAKSAKAVEAASDSRSRFLATVSHEIRTPLNGILGLGELLATTSLSPEQACYLDAIRASGQSLSTLIDEVLDFSKIEAGKLELRPGPFDLPSLVEGVTELLAPRAQEKGIEIASWIDPRIAQNVVGDAGRLRQILINLVGNAVKFTETGGVGVSVAPVDKESVRFSVSDAGPGIPGEYRSSIFHEFEQVDESRSRSHEGTGLGLAISRRLVDLMGGRIWLERSDPAGSTFAFEVALQSAEDKSAETCSPMLMRRKRTLVVSSSPFSGPYLVKSLELVGYDAEQIRTPLGALESLARSKLSPPNLLIVDGAFGKNYAQTLAYEAKKIGVDNRLIVFSPFERRTLGEEIMQDFNGWLVKPVRSKSLQSRLAQGQTKANSESESPSCPLAERVLAEHRILLAEDNEVNALLVERHLQRLGAEVVRASDGMAAVALAQQAMERDGRRFDAVLMDIRMPRLDGLAAARSIRAAEAATDSAPVRIVALTANPSEEDRIAAFDAGLDDFLTKPVKLEDIVKAITLSNGSPERKTLAARRLS